MNKKIGFNTKKYLDAQIKKILERVSLFDKLYLEFGGKLCYDSHASRVLPGFEIDAKVKMLRRLGDKIEIFHCISEKDIEGRKIRRDFGLTYEDQILKDISDIRKLGLVVSGVVINRFSNAESSRKFKQRLENRGIKVFVQYEIPNYTKDLDFVVSDKGYGKSERVDTEKKIVIVTAPGPGSGKMSFCMSQIFHDRKHGIKSGFAKFETFPIWNLDLNHPVNIAYEAATADIGDFNMIDPFHKRAYGVTAVNYNRDIENFAIMKMIIEKMVDKDDNLFKYKSPTDMGVNMAKDGIIDDYIVCEASKQEITRRYFTYKREFIEGNVTQGTLKRMNKIMKRCDVEPVKRSVVIPAREAEEDAKRRRQESKGFNGIFCGAAIEFLDNNGKTIIIKGKNSSILHAESAAVLNAIKTIAGIPDETNVISSKVIENMVKLKRSMGLVSTSLNVKEVLDALAASVMFDENSRKCIKVLGKLKGCEMHTTHLMDNEDEMPLKQLGLNITTDAKLPFLNQY